MADTQEYYRTMSMRLSRVLGDIGLNRWMVKRRRKTFLQVEANRTLSCELLGRTVRIYCFGSQSEGTTTPGLNSDTDVLGCYYSTNVITSLSDWKVGRVNLLMVKGETCSPQHYQLQEIWPDYPLPIWFPAFEWSAIDKFGRVLRRNTIFGNEIKAAFAAANLPCESRGPSHSHSEMFDYVPAYWCRSLPWECLGWFKWFNRPRPGHWPTEEIFRIANQCGCFLVADGHCDSVDNFVEWRLTPNLVERFLVFSMNNIMIKCYVVLKMIKSSIINTCLGNNGKLTAVFFAVEMLPPEKWREDRIMECIEFCLKIILKWTKIGFSPHYIMSDVNLFDGKLTRPQQYIVSRIILNVLKDHLLLLLHIDIDNLGQRLRSESIWVGSSNQTRMHVCWAITTRVSIYVRETLLETIFQIIADKSTYEEPDLCKFLHEYLQMMLMPSMQNSTVLAEENLLTAQVLAGFLASIFASYSIQHGYLVTPYCWSLYKLSLQTDVTSNRLKLASMLYCRGDLARAVNVLNYVERRYDESIHAVCRCGRMDATQVEWPEEFCKREIEGDDDVFCRNRFAMCVVFLPQEMFCVPSRLRREMRRDIRDDIRHRNDDERMWMNWAVVDSRPFLFYLQYLIYRDLGLRDKQVQAFRHLENCSNDERLREQVYHKETYMNLLGHCIEMEGQTELALEIYTASVLALPRNNAAHWHIDRLTNAFNIEQ